MLNYRLVSDWFFRFAFDIDLDAPKVRVPLRTGGSDRCDSHFLLDFGHFTLHTAVCFLSYKILSCDYCRGIFSNYPVFSQESHSDEQRQHLYSRFCITGRDIAAFFTDCGSDFGSCSLVKPNYDGQIVNSPITDKDGNVYSLIDRCGMAVLVNQVCLSCSSKLFYCHFLDDLLVSIFCSYHVYFFGYSRLKCLIQVSPPLLFPFKCRTLAFTFHQKDISESWNC